MEHKKAYVYGLIDPRDKKIHYVGHTIDLDGRLAGHLSDNANTPKTQWIADLAKVRVNPVMVVLDEVDYRYRHREEYRWIYLGKERGWPLTNTSAMKTERYDDLAIDIDNAVFVEIKPVFSWSLMKAYTKDVLWDEDKTLDYMSIRWTLIFIPLMGLFLGTMISGTSNVILTINNGDGTMYEYVAKLGELISIVSSLIALPVAGPSFVKYIWRVFIES